MVLTITLNPLLEKRYFVGKIKSGKTFRSRNDYYASGGKGVNVSRQLNSLGIDNLALIPIGGNTGKIYRHVIEAEGINFSAMSVKSEMRLGSVIVEAGKKVTTVIGENIPLLESDISKIKDKLDKMIENASTIVFAGSVPDEKSAEIICRVIERGNELDKVTILDTYGTHLQKCINAAPLAVHNNVSEIRNSLNLSLAGEEEIISYLKFLYESGVKIAAVTDGKNPAYFLKFGFLYKVVPPRVKEIDSTGSGDSLVAGIIYGLEKDLVFNKIMENAIALGAANASQLSTSSVQKEIMEELAQKVKITEIGEKMKVIDDSPQY
jgi:tagatose 6-phosphate kinase